MKEKKLIKVLGFKPKENSSGIFHKKYNGYAIEIDFEKKQLDFGDKIKSENKTTQNFSQPENWVVLECVDRLLEKGYKPENITLEKTWKTGHGTSGRLDVLVTREDGSAYLMIECKTWGKEYEKELKNIYKNGGQLFTYFQQDKDAEVIMLYASELDGNSIQFRNDIIKIEKEYRQTANVKDFFERWNKLAKNNGVFDSWVNIYSFESKALMHKDLKDISQEDSGFIFNQFLEILRHNVVSDKPNAFNKIFTLFLCKIYDEKYTKSNQELAFQWFYTPHTYEGISYPADDHVSFQKRLTDLYAKGMKAFLEKEVTDISDADFDRKYSNKLDDVTKQEIKDTLTKIRLEKNNEFAIKEVFNTDSFEENAIVVKEIVELLQGYRIRYTKKQQYLSDFFELLLTTGLKQESGQFFTPVPVAQFVIRSIPIDVIVNEKLEKGEKDNLLPTVIDYASGSGHFITESMHLIQEQLDQKNPDDYIESTAKKIKNWKEDHFDWAFQYVYGIEKDYRLVKVGKVGCYLHGDGLAQIVHSDGLGNFKKNKDYKGLLEITDEDFPKENKQFDIVVSNPPYSVSSFKNNARKFYTEEDFELYDYLTDNSSEIECLFIERTKQLLADGGIAGIILPSSILSNTGIYSKAREMILLYFDIIGIAEFGSNTFMATGTNTVTLFLRRRNNYDVKNIKHSVEQLFINLQDVTINGIENPLQKYITHVWEDISLDDYKTLLQKSPNETIVNHEIYQEYNKKIKAKNEQDKWTQILDLEQDKLLYFILAYKQKVVLVKTGQKTKEKQFLGYEFSNRRGSEGIHPIQRSKSIDECTQLYDVATFENPEKASTYIYNAFNGKLDLEIPETLKENISYQNLTDMLTFDRVDFEKSISLSAKKKVKYDEVWGTDSLTFLNEVAEIKKGKTITEAKTVKGNIPVIAGGKKPAYYHNQSNRNGNVITVSASGVHSGYVNYFENPIFASDCNTIISLNEENISTKLLYFFLKSIQDIIYGLQRGQAQPHVYADDLSKVKIPLPPKDIQQKIVSEIEVLEKQEEKAVEEIEGLNRSLYNFIDNTDTKKPLKHYLETINPNKNEVIKNLSDNTNVSFLSMSDVSNEGEIENLQAKTLEEVKRGYTFFQNDDVLFAKITPCTENGKGALVSNLQNNIGFGSTEFFVLRADKGLIEPKLLFYISKSEDFRKNAEKNMTGTSGHRRVPKSFIETYNVSLPPLSEQQKIVSEIEKIEQKITELEKQIAEIPKQKEAILKKYL